MKKFIITLFCIILILNQGINAKQPTDNALAKKDSQITSVIAKSDTINIKSFQQQVQSKPWYEGSSMPWVIALIISALTIAVNVIITLINLKRSRENLEKQINATKEIAIKQIENTKDLSFAQFKATLNTKNRQDWINELRDSISEFLAQCAMINVEMTSKSKNLEKIKPFFEIMVKNKSKISMLLNLEKPEQKEVLAPIYEIIRISLTPESDWDAKIYRELEEKLLVATRHLLGVHWKKIKNLE